MISNIARLHQLPLPSDFDGLPYPRVRWYHQLFYQNDSEGCNRDYLDALGHFLWHKKRNPGSKWTSLKHLSVKVEALWFKSFIVFLENLVSGTFICADNESKIKEIGWRLRFWDKDVAKTTHFLSKSHDLPHNTGSSTNQY